MSKGFTQMPYSRRGDSFETGERSSANGPPLEFVVNVHQERPASVLVSRTDDEDGRTAWLPRSLIEIEPTRSMGPHGVTACSKVPRWLAEREGLAGAVGEGQGELGV